MEQALAKTELKTTIKDKVLFTDSTTVLSGIKSASIKYKTYVKNKIIDIHELHPVRVWKYIPSLKYTTADLLSKECTYKELEKVIKGPEILHYPIARWVTVPSNLKLTK